MKESIGVPVDPPVAGCQDQRCAWHGRLPVRGRTFQGIVRSAKASHTVVVEWGYTQLVPKYERYERRKSRVTAHNPDCMKAARGDTVVIAECRPLSKTKGFVVVAVPQRRVERPEFKVAEVEAAAVEKARRQEAPRKASKGKAKQADAEKPGKGKASKKPAKEKE